MIWYISDEPDSTSFRPVSELLPKTKKDKQKLKQNKDLHLRVVPEPQQIHDPDPDYVLLPVYEIDKKDPRKVIIVGHRRIVSVSQMI